MTEAHLRETNPPPLWKRYGIDLIHTAFPIIKHGLAMMTAILFMHLSHTLVRSTMGDDAKFFDVLPVIYVIQTVDLATFIRFAINVWNDFR